MARVAGSNYTIYIKTTDNRGLDFSRSLNLTAQARPSNISINSKDFDENINAESVIAVLSTTDDDSEDTLSYDYSWSTGATGDTLTLDASIAPGSSIECTATATDGSDFVSGVASISVENRLPVVDSISITPTTPTATTTDFECVVSASDADGEKVLQPPRVEVA